MAIDEPPPPARGKTAEERGSDRAPAEQRLDEASGGGRRLLAAADPRFLLAQADGYPAGVRQFLQFCLVLIYPAWLFFVLVAWVGAGVWWILGKTVGKVLFELWWLCTGWFWRRHGGVKPGTGDGERP